MRCSVALVFLGALGLSAAHAAQIGPKLPPATGSASATASKPAPEPKVPAGVSPPGVPVALFDTGVNYTLPQISARLSRDGEGDLIGYDFDDEDLKPFDRVPVPAGAPAQNRYHGTSVASILLKEAGKSALVQPYRFKGGIPQSFAGMVAHTALTPARIVAMPLGGYRREDWEQFHQAAKLNPQILFIVSAGNDGRDIDRLPVFPASFDLDNILVVTATDDFGRYPTDSNWGEKAVDISCPAQGLEGFDNTGADAKFSGSSYAVPRIAALAARLAMRDRKLDAAALKAKIIKLAGPSPGSRTKRVKYGWIANPALIEAD